MEWIWLGTRLTLYQILWGAMILDGERPTLRSLAGGAVAVLGAAALAYR